MKTFLGRTSREWAIVFALMPFVLVAGILLVVGVGYLMVGLGLTPAGY